MVKKDGIYPIRQESIADTYAKAKVFQWQDFSFAYEDQQGRIYYNPTSGERSNGIYALSYGSGFPEGKHCYGILFVFTGSRR